MIRQRVVVGLSGGVDSSVAAWLLKQQGYEVVGLFMKNWDDDDHDTYCSARHDWIDVVSVADLIGIDVEAVNFAAEYRERVFAEFLHEYLAGRTPNPDVLCNAEIKFKAFLDHAMGLGADTIATGHYARVRKAGDRFELLKAKDPAKDQSYFLYRLNQWQLSRTLFPLGEIPKTQVRQMAAQIGLPNAKKKDSTGICFIGERPFRAFLNRYLPTRPGPIKTLDGRIVGEHIGLAFYTVGQRKGIGLGGRRGGSGQAWFVVGKELASNTLVVAQGHDHPCLLSTALEASNPSWIAGKPPLDGLDGRGELEGSNRPDRLNCTAKTRYRQVDAECTFEWVNAECAQNSGQSAVSDPASRFMLRFSQPQWAVTPGQSAVLYAGEVCLGGGIIDRSSTAASVAC